AASEGRALPGDRPGPPARAAGRAQPPAPADRRPRAGLRRRRRGRGAGRAGRHLVPPGRGSPRHRRRARALHHPADRHRGRPAARRPAAPHGAGCRGRRIARRGGHLVHGGLQQPVARHAPDSGRDGGGEEVVMYLQFYGLREAPFAPTPDPKFLFQSTRHREALAQLLYGVRERKGFTVLTGEIGTGKTTLLRTLLERLNSTTPVAYVHNSALGIEGLLEYILQDW